MRQLLFALATSTAIAGAAIAQTAPAPATTAPATTAPATTAPATTRVTVPQDAILSGQLDDLDLRNAANEAVGEVEDVVISQGRVVGYIVSVGGFLGVGDRNVVVDPNMINITYNENDKKWAAVINATMGQLQAIPEFKYEGRWEDDD
jgi:hypothetical protein